MKKLLLISTAVVLGLLAFSCEKSSSGSDDLGVIPTVKIQADNIADNKATISADLQEGKFYGAKVVTGLRTSAVSFDYTRVIPLIKYVEANGTQVELPYTVELSNLIFEQDYFCAVIVYDKTGRACASDFVTFTADGVPDGVSNDNSAGNLEDNPQQ